MKHLMRKTLAAKIMMDSMHNKKSFPKVQNNIRRIFCLLACLMIMASVLCIPAFAADTPSSTAPSISSPDLLSTTAVSGGGSAGTPNCYYLPGAAKRNIDQYHSFYKDAESYDATDLRHNIGKFFAMFNYSAADVAYNTFFKNAYKTLRFTQWTPIIRDRIFGNGYSVAIIAVLTVGLIALGIQMLYRQEEMVSSRRAIVKQVVAVMLIIFGMPFLLNILSTVALSGVTAGTSMAQTNEVLQPGDTSDSYFNNVVRTNVLDWYYIAARGGLGVADGSRKDPTQPDAKNPPENELTGSIYTRCLSNAQMYGQRYSKDGGKTGDLNYIDPASIQNGLAGLEQNETLTETTLNAHKNPAAMVATLARQYNEDIINAVLELNECYEAMYKEAQQNNSKEVSNVNVKTGWHPTFDYHYSNYVRYVRDAELEARAISHYWPTNSSGKIINVGNKNAKDGELYVETEDEGTQLIGLNSDSAILSYGSVINKTDDQFGHVVKMANAVVRNAQKSGAWSTIGQQKSLAHYVGTLVLIQINEDQTNQEGADAVEDAREKAAAAGNQAAGDVQKGIQKGGETIKKEQDKAAEKEKEKQNRRGNLISAKITFSPMFTVSAYAADTKDSGKGKDDSTKGKDDDSTKGKDASQIDPSTSGTPDNSQITPDTGGADDNSITSVALSNVNGGPKVTDPKVDPNVWKGCNTDGSLQDTVKSFLLHTKEGQQVDSSGSVGKQMGGAKFKPYYRYSIDYASIGLECFALFLAYLALAYKVLRTIFDIVLTSIVAPFFASVDFMTQGTKTKEIFKGLFQAYATLLFYPIVIDVYMIGCRFLSNTWGNPDTHAFYLMALFAWSIAIMDTPVILGNLLGQQTQRSFLNDLSQVATGVNQAQDFMNRNGKRIAKIGGSALKTMATAAGAVGGGMSGAIMGAGLAAIAGSSGDIAQGNYGQVFKNLNKGLSDMENKAVKKNPQRKALASHSAGSFPTGNFFNQQAHSDTKSALSSGKSDTRTKQLSAASNGAIPSQAGSLETKPLSASMSPSLTGAMAGGVAGNKAGANANAKANAHAGGRQGTDTATSSKTKNASSVSHREASQTSVLHTTETMAAGAVGAAAGQSAAGKSANAGTNQAKVKNEHTATNENKVDSKNTRTSEVESKTRVKQERAAVLNGATAGAAAGTTAGAVSGASADAKAIGSVTTAGERVMLDSAMPKAGTPAEPVMANAATADTSVSEAHVRQERAATLDGATAGAVSGAATGAATGTVTGTAASSAAASGTAGTSTSETRQHQVQQQNSVQSNTSHQSTVSSAQAVNAHQEVRTERDAVLNGTGTMPASAGTSETVQGGQTTVVNGMTVETPALGAVTSAGAAAMPNMNTVQAQTPVMEPVAAPAAADTSSTVTNHQTVMNQSHVVNEQIMESREHQIHNQTISQTQHVQASSVASSAGPAVSSTQHHTVNVQTDQRQTTNQTNTVNANTEYHQTASVSGDTAAPAMPQIPAMSMSFTEMAVPSPAARQAEPVYADMSSAQSGAPVTENQTVHVMHQTMPGQSSVMSDEGGYASERMSQPVQQTANRTVNVMMSSSGGSYEAPTETTTIHQSMASMAAPSSGTTTVNRTVTQQSASAGSQTVNQTTVVQGQAASGGNTVVQETVVQKQAAAGGSYGGGSYNASYDAPSMATPHLSHVSSDGYVRSAPAAPVQQAAQTTMESFSPEPVAELGSATSASAASLGEQAAEILLHRTSKVKSYSATAPSLKKTRRHKS